MAGLDSRSQQLYRRAREVIPGGVNSPVRSYSPYPLFVASAKGSKFKTVDGQEYLDYCMAYGALIDGHVNAEVVEAVEEALERGSIYGQPTEKEGELAELIASMGASIQMVSLVKPGAAATMHAIRVARAVTGKKKALTVEGGSH